MTVQNDSHNSDLERELNLTELQDDSGDSDQEPAQDPVVALALHCQASYAAWRAATDPEQVATLSAVYKNTLEELWYLLAADLRSIARGWIRSNMAPDSETLALSIFANIVFRLPKLRIDPQQKVRSLLLVVARRGLIDEYRRTYAASAQRQLKSQDQHTAPAPGSGEARMWQPLDQHHNHSPSIDSHPELVDPHSNHADEHLVSLIDHQAVLKAVWDYWPLSLSPSDLQIMKLRWQSEPPCSFREIAEGLGAGWEEDTVRQRHHRIINTTRRYLREQGLIDDNSSLDSIG